MLIQFTASPYAKKAALLNSILTFNLILYTRLLQFINTIIQMWLSHSFNNPVNISLKSVAG